MRFWVDRHIESETYPKAHLIKTLKEERVCMRFWVHLHFESETYPKAHLNKTLKEERVHAFLGRSSY